MSSQHVDRAKAKRKSPEERTKEDREETEMEMEMETKGERKDSPMQQTQARFGACMTVTSMSG